MAKSLSAKVLTICCSSIRRSNWVSSQQPTHFLQSEFDPHFRPIGLLLPESISYKLLQIFCNFGVCSSKVASILNFKIMEQPKNEVTSSTGAKPIAEESEILPDKTETNEVEHSGVETTDSNSNYQQLGESDAVGSSECEGQVSQSGKDVNEGQRVYLRKKKTVLMLSYCGQGYLGMQKNPGRKTIEDDLLKSLLKSGYIDEEAYNKPQMMQFQRAARTDKNVSAARQIVSMKLPEKVDLKTVNQLLPPQIRVMGMKKVTKGFDCKSTCDARTYMYMIPTFAFVPLEQNVTEDYRITPEVLENLREALKLFLGTKNYHNFTSRRKPTDPSAKRYIISFTASDPFIKDGLEYLILRVKGQSFMLHQIRKMIGLVAAYLRGFAGKETFIKSWTLDRIDIPKAPGVGLVLDHVHYERYNKRYGSDGMHSALSWEEINQEVEDFCQTYIYPVITKCENEEKSMMGWLATLPYHTYDVREQKANEEITSSFSGIGNAAYHLEKKSVLKDDEESDADSDAEADSEEVPRKRSKLAQEVGT